jgi:hypothetical protein
MPYLDNWQQHREQSERFMEGEQVRANNLLSPGLPTTWYLFDNLCQLE